MSVDDLQNKIKQKLDVLSTSLTTLKGHQKTLQENSTKAKNYFKVSSDKEINLLRQKERNLLDQIEVVTETQKRVFDSQIAKLVQIKGSLYATLKILLECQLEDLSALTNLYDGYVTSLKPIEDFQTLSVQNLITSALSSFEKMHLQENKAMSECCSVGIPSSLEDYGDAEQDILHKSIKEGLESSDDECCAIKVQIPKMPAGGWLAKSSDRPPARVWLAKPPSGEKFDCCKDLFGRKSEDVTSLPNKKNEDMASLPCRKGIEDLSSLLCRKENDDLSSWLSDIRVPSSSGSGESFDLLDEEFVVTPSLERRTRCSSTVSSSIEVVSSLDYEKERVSVSESEFDNAKSCWLSISQSSKKTALECVMPMDMEEFACQANEPCNSYNDCLCDGYCNKLANERALQTKKWLLKNELEQKAPTIIETQANEEGSHPTGVKRKLSPTDGGNEVLKHMRSILFSDRNKWLSSASLNTPDTDRNENIAYKPRTESWLSDAVKPVENKVTEVPPIITYSPHSNIWLLHKLKQERKQEQNQKNLAAQNQQNQTQDHENSFHHSIEEIQSAVSVNDLQGALAELSILIPKFSPTKSNIAPVSGYYSGFPPASIVLNQNLNNLYRNNDFDLSRKLKWLARSHSIGQSSCRGDTPSSSPNCLPNSLLEFAERNLDKWLMNRL